MFVKFEDPAVVQPQSFPHCVTSLHGRVKRADPSLIAMHQLSIDVYEQISVSLVEFLKHREKLIRKPGKQETVLNSSHRARPFLVSQQSVLVQLFVAIARTLVGFAELFRQFMMPWTIWLE